MVGSEFPMPAISTFVPFLTFGITVGTILVFPPLLLVHVKTMLWISALQHTVTHGILLLMGAVNNHTIVTKEITFGYLLEPI